MGGRGAKFSRIAANVLVGVGCGILAVTWLAGMAHPDLTPQRLLLRFWPEYAAGLTLMLAGLALHGRGREL